MAEALVSSRKRWRSFAVALWLGWQIESNWAQPLVFAIYTVLRPLALAGILVAMYAALNRDGFGSPAFAYMYIGNAFYMYVGAVMSGMGWAVVQDREHYRTLKSVYTAPVDLRLYLVGRGFGRLGVASCSVLIVLALGVAVLGIGIAPGRIDWMLFIAAMLLGLVILSLMGLVTAGIMLLAGNEAWQLGDMLAGAMFLFSGAVFPLTALPAILRPIGMATPVTYWLELVRRSLTAETVSAFPALASWSDGGLLLMVCALTAALAVISTVSFHLCETRARSRGLIDRTSNY